MRASKAPATLLTIAAVVFGGVSAIPSSGPEHAATATATATAARADVPTPESFFGFAMGDDGRLAGFDKIKQYFR